MGGEVYYRLHSPISGRVTAVVTPADGDLDLVALGAENDTGCDVTDQCLAISQTDGVGAVEQVTIPVTAGRIYYFVVDGWAGARAGFTMAVFCEKEP